MTAVGPLCDVVQQDGDNTHRCITEAGHDAGTYGHICVCGHRWHPTPEGNDHDPTAATPANQPAAAGRRGSR